MVPLEVLPDGVLGVHHSLVTYLAPVVSLVVPQEGGASPDLDRGGRVAPPDVVLQHVELEVGLTALGTRVLGPVVPAPAADVDLGGSLVGRRFRTEVKGSRFADFFSLQHSGVVGLRFVTDVDGMLECWRYQRWLQRRGW